MSESNGASNGRLQTELVFDEVDLEPRFLTVHLRRKASTETYVVNQASEADSNRMENYRHRKARLEQGRIVTVEGMAESVPFLVSLCTKTAEGKSVPQAVVESWPPKVVRKIHRWILDNSGLMPEETPEYLREMIAAYTKRLAEVEALTDGTTAKNSPDATPATSA